MNKEFGNKINPQYLFAIKKLVPFVLVFSKLVQLFHYLYIALRRIKGREFSIQGFGCGGIHLIGFPPLANC
jgi:hypothetical protein